MHHEKAGNHVIHVELGGARTHHHVGEGVLVLGVLRSLAMGARMGLALDMQWTTPPGPIFWEIPGTNG